MILRRSWQSTKASPDLQVPAPAKHRSLTQLWRFYASAGAGRTGRADNGGRGVGKRARLWVVKYAGSHSIAQPRARFGRRHWGAAPRALLPSGRNRGNSSQRIPTPCERKNVRCAYRGCMLSGSEALRAGTNFTIPTRKRWLAMVLSGLPGQHPSTLAARRLE